MPTPTEPFFEILKDSFKDVDWDKLSSKEHNSMTGTITAAVSGYDEEVVTDLSKLKDELAKKNIRLGKYIDNGRFAYIFELENLDGEKVDGAVIRLGQAATSGKLDSPVAIQPEFVVDSGFYRASIVPRAQRVEFSEDDIKHSFAVLNTEEKLDGLRDLQNGELLAQPFMGIPMPDGDVMRYRDGKPVAVLIDLNSVKQETSAFDGMGDIDSFLTLQGWDRDKFMAAKESTEELDHLRVQQKIISEKLRADLKAAGITIENVPTQITDATAANINLRSSDKGKGIA